MGELSIVLAVLAATVLAVPLGDRLRLPYPLLMLVFGLVLAVMPGVPALEVNPELILPLLLPPLLYSAARRTSWLEFKRNWRAITLLAVALVLVTAFVVGGRAAGAGAGAAFRRRAGLRGDGGSTGPGRCDGGGRHAAAATPADQHPGP